MLASATASFVDLDVSLDETSVCVVDGDGRVVWRGKVASEPKAIAKVLAKHAGDAERVGLESGALSTWLWHELKRLGLPIACLDARQVKAALMLQIGNPVSRAPVAAANADHEENHGPGNTCRKSLRD